MLFRSRSHVLKAEQVAEAAVKGRAVTVKKLLKMILLSSLVAKNL